MNTKCIICDRFRQIYTYIERFNVMKALGELWTKQLMVRRPFINNIHIYIYNVENEPGCALERALHRICDFFYFDSYINIYKHNT